MACGCGFAAGCSVPVPSRRPAWWQSARLKIRPRRACASTSHAHLWTDDYLDLCQGYGNVDTGTQRNKGAGMGRAEMDKRFALMEAAALRCRFSTSVRKHCRTKIKSTPSMRREKPTTFTR